jgi:hypothetical protein
VGFDGQGYGGTDHRVAVAPDGSAYVASGMFDGRIERLDAAGVIDPSFGENGVVTTSMDAISSLSVTRDGKLLVQGGRYLLFDGHLELVDTLMFRLNSDGSTDPTFNAGQPIVNDPFVGGSLTHPLPDGSTFLAIGLGPYYSEAFALKKLLPDGRIAPSADVNIPDPTDPFPDSGGQDSLPADPGDAADPPVIDDEDSGDFIEIAPMEGDRGSSFALTPSFFDDAEGATLFDPAGSVELLD